MRILMVANAAATHTQRWASAMSQRGHEVVVATVRDHQIDGVEVRATRSGAESLSPLSLGFGYAKLPMHVRSLQSRFGADVIHAHYASTNGYAVALSGVRPVALTVWGTDVVPKPDKPLRATQRHRARKAIEHAAVVTSASEFMAAHTRAIADPADLRVIPFGVDLDAFAPAGPPSGAVVLVAKNLEEKYGVEHVVRAMATVQEQVAGAQLVVAGDGSERSSLEALAGALGVDADFVGHVPHQRLPEVIANAALVVNPTIVDESFGVILLEAQAVGRAVVSTDVGAVRGVALEGKTALFVPPNDVGAMAGALISVLQGEQLAEAPELGPRFVSDNWAWEDCVTAMEEAYSSAAR